MSRRRTRRNHPTGNMLARQTPATEVATTGVRQEQLDIMSSALESMRGSPLFTDVTLVCDNREFPAHKVVLSAGSSYFHIMFTIGMKESLTGRVELKGIDAFALGVILEFLYSGHVDSIATNDEDQLKSLLSASHLLQVNVLQAWLWQHLESKVSVDWFAELWNLAALYDNKKVHDRIVSFVTSNITAAAKSADFLEITPAQLTCLVRKMNTEPFPVDDTVLFVLTWLKHNPEERQHSLETFLCCIEPLKYLSTTYLRLLLSTEPLLRASPQAFSMLSEVAVARLGQNDCQVSGVQPWYMYSLKLVCFGSTRRTKGAVNLFDYKNKAWNRRKTLPFELEIGMTPVPLGEYIFFLGGGATALNCVSRVLKYELVSNTFAVVSNMHVERYCPGGASLNGNVYVVGGTGLTLASLNSVECYNPLTNVWREMAPMTCNHTGPVQVLALQDCLYVLSYFSDIISIERWDANNNQWCVVTERVFLCVGEHPSAAVCHAKFFVSRPTSSHFQVYDPITDRWSSKSVQVSCCQGMWSVCGTERQLPFIMVCDSRKSLYQYDPLHSQWQVLSKCLNRPWYWHQTVLMT